MAAKVEKQPVGQLVCFDLPFYVDTKDSVWDNQIHVWSQAHAEGDGASVYSPYAPHPAKRVAQTEQNGGNIVHLPIPPMDDCYEVKVPGIDSRFELRFLKRLNQVSQAQISGNPFGDRGGKYIFSTVEVRFNFGSLRQEFWNNLPILAGVALTAVNRFIEHYRVVTKRYYISTITPPAIGDFHCSAMYDDGSFGRWLPTSLVESPRYTDDLYPYLKREHEVELRANLVNDSEPAFSKRLYLEAQDKLSLNQWRLAIIESEILFETWLNSHVRFLFRCKGLSEEDIDKEFVRNDRRSTRLSAYAIAKNLIKKASDFGFSQTAEFKEWDDRVLKLRNDIAHGDTFQVDPSDARETLKIVERAIEVIEKNTPISNNQVAHPTLHKWFKESVIDAESEIGSIQASYWEK